MSYSAWVSGREASPEKSGLSLVTTREPLAVRGVAGLKGPGRACRRPQLLRAAWRSDKKHRVTKTT